MCSFEVVIKSALIITSNYSKLQEKAGKVQTANTSGPFFYDDVGVA